MAKPIQDWMLDAAAEIAALKAYMPDKIWTYKELQQTIAEIIAKHEREVPKIIHDAART